MFLTRETSGGRMDLSQALEEEVLNHNRRRVGEGHLRRREWPGHVHRVWREPGLLQSRE